MNCEEDKETSYLQFEAILMVGNPAHSNKQHYQGHRQRCPMFS